MAPVYSPIRAVYSPIGSTCKRPTCKFTRLKFPSDLLRRSPPRSPRWRRRNGLKVFEKSLAGKKCMKKIPKKGLANFSRKCQSFKLKKKSCGIKCMKKIPKKVRLSIHGNFKVLNFEKAEKCMKRIKVLNFRFTEPKKVLILANFILNSYFLFLN